MKTPDPRPPRVRAPDPRDAEAKQHALEKIRAICLEDVDPFAADAGDAFVREKVKKITAHCEANAALIVEAANAGTDHAHAALAELISEHNAAGESLGAALTAYAHKVSRDGPARIRLPRGRRRYNILEDRIIVCMVLDLMQKFPGLKLRRGPDTKRATACSIVADVLRDERIWDWRGEERVRKIWVRHGPPAIATYRRSPPPGVVRFTSDDI
jgi:hypothetical protein